MKWASAIADGRDMKVALEQCISRIQQDLGPGSPPSLVVVFLSAAYGGAAGEVPRLLTTSFPQSVVLGCSAGGVIGNGQEIEDRLAVTVTAGHLPGVKISPFQITATSCPSPDDPPEAWRRLVGVGPEEKPSFLILIDPFSAPGEHLAAGLDFAFPGSAKVGGLASGGFGPGSHLLYLGSESYRSGAVGVALSGAIVVDTVVAQGCRPIGEPKRITRCQDNILMAIDGQAPIPYLRNLYPSLSQRDQELVNSNLFMGIAMDPVAAPSDLRPGDFLIRNIVGADQEGGMLAVGEYLREGQLVQFHVRDALTSAEDLQQQLARYLSVAERRAIQGALLFQCNGRGRNLYGRPNHDSNLFREMVGSLPLGGFFCSGEIGQVSGTTYLHGYTSSFAVFRSP